MFGFYVHHFSETPFSIANTEMTVKDTPRRIPCLVSCGFCAIEDLGAAFAWWWSWPWLFTQCYVQSCYPRTWETKHYVNRSTASIVIYGITKPKRSRYVELFVLIITETSCANNEWIKRKYTSNIALSAKMVTSQSFQYQRQWFSKLRNLWHESRGIAHFHTFKSAWLSHLWSCARRRCSSLGVS